MHLYVPNFSIRVFEQENDAALFAMDGGNSLLEIKSDTSLFNPNATVILADPFMFVKGDTLYLFYEHLDQWFGTGRICMRSTKDLHTWTEEVDVLIEPFHLSFPYVFDDNDKVYMLPETGGDRSVRLYEAADESLTKWKLVERLMEDDVPWYDSIIHKKDDMYYLFTGRDDDVQQTEHLFFSERLTGPYKEHPMSPIYIGRDGGRMAGSLVFNNGKLFRPVQVCINSYGEQTSVMIVKKLTPTEYEENVYQRNIIDTTKEPYIFGGHQWNSVEFLGRRIVATDYRQKNYNVIETARKIIRVLKR